LQCVTVCYSVLQCVAVCCSVLLCVAVCCSVCSVLQCVAVCCSVWQCVAVCCSVLQYVAVCMQCVEMWCSVFAVRCSMLQCFAVCRAFQTQALNKLFQEKRVLYLKRLHFSYSVYSHVFFLNTCHSLWVLCHLTGFARLVSGRSTCSLSFFTQSHLCIIYFCEKEKGKINKEQTWQESLSL